MLVKILFLLFVVIYSIKGPFDAKTQNGLTLIDNSDNKLSLDGFLIQPETTLLYPEGDRPDDNIKFNETSVFTAILESIN